ncbi:hypothetical protein AZE42_02838 [Rhizopogon vesiculosus]|uniref:Uncharacterized protein n=1 Tax=Rhizopogon vesiculosus TaxID=180088 RepID=A0A1J8Q433_9AGAM|nr:hypothetical protein AZE42_02838 [Rhizopogon vesiculosus]
MVSFKNTISQHPILGSDTNVVGILTRPVNAHSFMESTRLVFYVNSKCQDSQFPRGSYAFLVIEGLTDHFQQAANQFFITGYLLVFTVMTLCQCLSFAHLSTTGLIGGYRCRNIASMASIPPESLH